MVFFNLTVILAKRSKNFDERQHYMSCRYYNFSLSLPVVIDTGMISFAAYTAAGTASACQWAYNPKYCPIQWGILTPI